MTKHAAVAAVLTSDTALTVGAAAKASSRGLSELFKLARSNALKADEMFDNLLKELGA
jgi:hypothetical protein